jgi:hypothetical protein
MQHSAYATTQRYINMGQKLKPTLPHLYIPDLNQPAAKKDSAASGPYHYPYHAPYLSSAPRRK